MIHFGIIGAGIRGSMYADTLSQNSYAELTAICDADQRKLGKFGQQGIRTYDDYKKMFDDANLNAVIIATPDFLHLEPALCAAEAGCHILVEKPLATTSEDASLIAKTITEHDVLCMVAFENRWNAPFVAVKNEIALGNLGKVVSINFTLNDTIFVPTEMLPWAKLSSPGWFLFPHAIDLVCWLTGDQIKRIYGWAGEGVLKTMGIETYDSMKALLEFNSGFAASFNSTWTLQNTLPLVYDLKVEIIGSKNSYYIDLQDQMVRQYGGEYKNLHTLGYSVDGRMLGAPSLMLFDFIDHIRKGKKPESDHIHGEYITKIIDAIHVSAKDHKIIEV
ncbi:Gfo/Idh/MocA family protein [Sediminispirochaeta bajacaliforniensis]|uniref:Gfo/Idh/MocA family protein n=1 Tax=Sediminispirochaeta bajacaliforniensis TaxID=148 RepID=UPI00037C91ED|nr:Gfo/Idh/MocA family oxidoreductase [Sediminispirochaeta bajacaliforniensis]